MESKNSLWNKFVLSGKVSDYLAYSQKKENQSEGTEEVKKDTDQRNSNKNY